jgi:hypothetical protein
MELQQMPGIGGERDVAGPRIAERTGIGNGYRFVADEFSIDPFGQLSQGNCHGESFLALSGDQSYRNRRDFGNANWCLAVGKLPGT